jgi:hypothetical protein
VHHYQGSTVGPFFTKSASMSETSPVLFDDFPAPVFISGEPVKEWTGEQLKAHRPDVADAIVKLHLAGVTYGQMAAAFNISRSTIRSILRASKVVLDSAREGLTTDFRMAAQRLVERVHEVLDDDEQRAKVSAKDASFAAATLSERADTQSGHASQIIDVQVSDAGRDEFMRLAIGLGQARARTMQAAEGGQGEVIEAEVSDPAEVPAKQIEGGK